MAEDAHPQLGALSPQGGFEPENVSYRGLLVFIGILVAMVLGTWFVVHLTFKHFTRVAAAENRQMLAHEVVPSVAASRPYFPEPREQISPQADLSALRARESAELENYGWINRTAGVVRLPIDRAMALIAQHGLPRADTNAPKTGPSSLQLQQQRPLQPEPSRTNGAAPR